jgi:ubiquinol oxidase
MGSLRNRPHSRTLEFAPAAAFEGHGFTWMLLDPIIFKQYSVCMFCDPADCKDLIHSCEQKMKATDTRNSLDEHRATRNLSDRIALGITMTLRFFADTFFAKRYGNRAIVLETVAAVPGMVGGMLVHLRCLRWMVEDHGWIRTLLDEAENERMHLMTFVQIAKPNWFERLVILLVQAIFFVTFFLLYLGSPRTAHRLVGYFEEQAVISYTSYLAEIDAGRVENVAAPDIAIAYWNLPATARLRDVVLAVREDEMGHRDVNHEFADALTVLEVHQEV